MMIGSSAQMKVLRAQMWMDLRASDASPLDVYRMLEAYYLNNGLYERTQQELFEHGIWTAGMKSLRNPARRTVEFHVTHVWPGALEKALPVLAENVRMLAPLRQVWGWSNWGVKKQLAVRWFALYGDWFCKVAASTDAHGRVKRVFLQNIKPELVSDFEVDERGNIIFIRLDIPLGRHGGEGRRQMHTEIWTREEFRLYLHNLEPGAAETRLGPVQTLRKLADFGIDFVPFVHAPFIDWGEQRGLGVFTLALDKIDEANRMATRLHQMIFRYNRPTVAIMANATDASGRPLPPPRFDAADGADPAENAMPDEDIRSFPGNSKMEFLVPNLNYSAHLEAINAQMRELEEDLPELAYYRQREMGASISGKAVRLLLAQAVDRTLEARGNIETALVKADKMALTMGSRAGLFGAIGSYEQGDFEHSFAEREVVPFSTQEQAETLRTEVQAGVPLVLSARRRGWSAKELAELEDAQGG